MTNSAQELFQEGIRLMQSGKTAVAEQCFRNAVKLEPEFAAAWANLGHLRAKAGDAPFAELCFMKAIAFDENLEPAFLMLGVLLMNQKRFAESDQLLRNYLQRHPRSAAAWSNLGVLLACQKREKEAEQCYRTALTMDDDYSKASFNLSYILLRQQRWEEGWRRLEDRWQYPLLENHFRFPRWRGEPLFGKAIIIGFEMGHGDMIFYARYIAELKKRGARQIAMIVQPGLQKLFATLEGLDQLYSLDDEVPPTGWDYWSPPMSLPHYCLTRTDNIPAATPYLFADSLLAAHWGARLPVGKLRVGLVWKGNPLFENDADRSIPSLSVFAPLAGIRGVQFIGLQKGAGETEQAPQTMPWLPLGVYLNDFAQTAAIIENLDLVISVDTAVAHLAGAMGKPTWVLLPDFRCDWRWMSEGETTPWYPEQVRLFRQSTMGDWSGVISDLKINLNALQALSALKV